MNKSLDKLALLLGEGVKKDVLLAPYTTFKVGGPADLFIEAKSKEQCIDAYNQALALHIPVTVIGGGSNILIGDKGIRGLVIKNMTRGITVVGMKGKYEKGEPVGTIYVEAESGVIFNAFVRFTIEEGYKGIEMHLGLPGTVGGALYMNSKWTNPPGAVGDAVYQAQLLMKNGEVKTVSKEYFSFDYDYSVLQKSHEVILSVIFEFTQEKKDILWQRADESIHYRRKTQPQGIFTAGCTFRNIPLSEAYRIPTPNRSTSAGYLIDNAGLKGYTVGKASISTEHANFIVNTGGATASDIVQLIETAKQKVYEKFGVHLEEEIVRLGEY
jgi:UDP-N-acetylmuramate dehydrogenase